jgi:hypothetical protein
VNREFNDEAKYTVKRIPNNGQRNFALLEKVLTTTEESGDSNLNTNQGANHEIICIENGGSSESKTLDDYGDESTSNRVQVVFIGGNEQANMSDSLVKEEQYESDKLEEEKVTGDRTYFKGKPKQDAEVYCNEHIMRSRSPIGFPESIKKLAYNYQHDLDYIPSAHAAVSSSHADDNIQLPKSEARSQESEMA